jgi:two-component SAPR family response regulator
MRATSVDRDPMPARFNGARRLARASEAGGGSILLDDAVEGLTSALDARIAHLDRQLAALRRLVAPVTQLSPAPRERSEVTPAVTCLGSFQFRVAGSPVVDWRSGKARALFQYLVSHRGRAVPNDTLIHALWPEPGAAAPGSSLKVAVHALRQALKRINRAECTIDVVSHESSYRLDASDLWVDVEEFERCYHLGRERDNRGQLGEALALYARAADLYRGDFLEELSDDWLIFRREALKDQYLFLLFRLAHAAVAAEDYQSGIARCQELLAKDRCREDTYRLLMVSHGRLGQRSRVRAWFELCAQALRHELDCEPDEETKRIYRQALVGKI